MKKVDRFPCAGGKVSEAVETLESWVNNNEKVIKYSWQIVSHSEGLDVVIEYETLDEPRYVHPRG